VTSIEAIPQAVADAVTLAASGRPGGAYIDLPADVLHSRYGKREGGSKRGRKEGMEREEWGWRVIFYISFNSKPPPPPSLPACLPASLPASPPVAEFLPRRRR